MAMIRLATPIESVKGAGPGGIWRTYRNTGVINTPARRPPRRSPAQCLALERAAEARSLWSQLTPSEKQSWQQYADDIEDESFEPAPLQCNGYACFLRYALIMLACDLEPVAEGPASFAVTECRQIWWQYVDLAAGKLYVEQLSPSPTTTFDDIATVVALSRRQRPSRRADNHDFVDFATVPSFIDSPLVDNGRIGFDLPADVVPGSKLWAEIRQTTHDGHYIRRYSHPIIVPGQGQGVAGYPVNFGVVDNPYIWLIQPGVGLSIWNDVRQDQPPDEFFPFGPGEIETVGDLMDAFETAFLIFIYHRNSSWDAQSVDTVPFQRTGWTDERANPAPVLVNVNP